MSESFLSRWSRRKEEARRVGQGSEPQSDGAAELASDARPPATVVEDSAAEPELTAEEVARLPKLDELTAESDVTGFLRRGVPEALRNAALRQAWMLDPAIRDFVGHARDYAYDWNAPGGVPGSGALQPEDVAAMVRRVFGDFEPEASSPGPTTGEDPRERAPAAARSVAETPAAVQGEVIRDEKKSGVEGSEAESPLDAGGTAIDPVAPR